MVVALEEESSDDGNEEKESRSTHGRGRVALNEVGIAKDLLGVVSNNTDISAAVVELITSTLSSLPGPLEESTVGSSSAGEGHSSRAISVSSSSESGGAELLKAANSSVVRDVPLDVSGGRAVAGLDVPGEIVSLATAEDKKEMRFNIAR